MTRTTTAAPMTATAATSRTRRSLLLTLLLRPVPAAANPAARAATGAAIVFGAAMVAVSAAIHLHLWLIGYRHIHIIGSAFLFQSTFGLALAPALVAFRRLVVVVAGVAYCGGSVVALLLSATVGFLGLHDGLSVPWAGWSLASELAGLVALATVAGFAFRRK
ncbi:MAG: hypothetical protein QOJ78_646 [Pseudonocardiales bacterium]|jgi:hypothetical protein|nr:hypothetical protein [Pseudonocardiales bacterium]